MLTARCRLLPGVCGPADNFDASPGVTPERSGVQPMSLTDTALLQLTQSLTSISIGPIGGKRPYESRDG